MLTPKEKGDYDYFYEDLASSLQCPQCRASKYLDATNNEHQFYRGFRYACHDILKEPHKCGKVGD